MGQNKTLTAVSLLGFCDQMSRGLTPLVVHLLCVCLYMQFNLLFCRSYLQSNTLGENTMELMGKSNNIDQVFNTLLRRLKPFIT